MAGVALLLCLAAHAQPAPEGSAQRPRIGLALSGGGARGAAHIGVLKVLEELRVPVHCVAGTSMGAVVGGAYAAGTTPSEMERLIASTDWTDVFTDRPPREEIAVRRKIDDYKHLFAPEFGVRDGALLMPRGVVAGVTIEQFLRRLAAPAIGISDFSALPIPYRAVAADIESGGQVVIEKGSLVQAMRASMAIPGAVTPVDVNGQLLVDGGIANNLPIDVVRATCADVVIAVNISTPPMKRGEITSAFSVVAQLVNLLGKDRVDQQLRSMGDLDVLISPELGGITAGSFDRQAEAIGIGEAAARSMASVLARYSLPPAEYAELRLSQSAVEKSLGRVDEIRFEGIQRTNPEVLATLVESKPGESLSDETLAADLRRIYGRGDFEAVDYRIDHTSSGGRALVIPVREKEIGPDYLRFGVGMATDFSDEAVFSLLLSYRRSWLNRAGGEWLTEAQIGKSNYLFSEFYQPLERAGHLFIAPYGQVGQTLLGVSDHDQRVAEYRVREARLGMDVGVNLGTWGEARFGPLVRDISATVATGDPVLPRADAKVAGLRFSLFGDTNDTPWFPRTGHRVSVTAFASTDEWGNAPSYRRLEASWSGAYSVGAHTATVTLKGGAAIDSRLPAYDAFELGGPLLMSGYHIRQFTGERMAFASLNYYNQWVRLPSLLGSGTYVGGTIEAGRMDRLYDGRASTGTLWSGSLYLAAETFLGPGFLGFGFNRNGGSTLYLVIGVP